MAKAKMQQLKVVFDTSVLITEATAELVRREVASLIAKHSGHADLRVTWCMPDIVLHERTYQMQVAGRDLLPQIAKTERLLGHNLNITAEILDDRVRAIVESALTKNGLTRLMLDNTRAEWGRIIADAAYRRPPFDAGKKEKGFRDALVMETLVQLIEDSPRTAAVCLIAFVSGDKLLVEAARIRAAGLANVRLVENLEELEGLINTLVSEVGEDVLTKLGELAKSYFFVKDDRTTLIFREGVIAKIKADFGSELAAMSTGADSEDLVGINVSKPEFLRKQKRRFHWRTRIAFRYQPFLHVNVPGQPNVPSLNALLGLDKPAATFGQGLLATPAPSTTTKQPLDPITKGFDVDWSVTIGMTDRFSAPKIEEIRFVGIAPT